MENPLNIIIFYNDLKELNKAQELLFNLELDLLLKFPVGVAKKNSFQCTFDDGKQIRILRISSPKSHGHVTCGQRMDICFVSESLAPYIDFENDVGLALINTFNEDPEGIQEKLKKCKYFTDDYTHLMKHIFKY